MKTVRIFLLATFLCLSTFQINAQFKKEITPYVSYLKNNAKLSAKEYVISMFKDNDIVILCERHHQEITQYDLFLDILKDPYFIENVGVIFTEVGAQTLNPDLNIFLQNENLTEEEKEKKVLDFQRQCMFSVWDKSNFSYFIKGIHDINKKLVNDKKINMYPTDIIYVEGQPTEEKVKNMMMTRMIKRDELMGDYIIEKFASMKKVNPNQKALVIMNYRHAYKKIVPKSSDNTGIYLAETYPGKVANILINNYNTFKKEALQEGKWDAAFKATDIKDTGFSFDGSPFGEDYFDHWTFENDNTYKMMFDGFVFYRPLQEFTLAIGLHGFMEDGFFEEAVTETEMYEKILSGIQKREPSPVDKEWLKRLNNIQINPIPNLDSIKQSINRWLE